MSNNIRGIERLALISEKIETILEICENGIVAALDDKKIKRAAILMHLMACNEQLQKIQDSGDLQILSIFAPENIRGLRGVRNATAHDYEGVNLAIIEDVIRNYLPPLKEKIDNFIKEYYINLENENSNLQIHKIQEQEFNLLSNNDIDEIIKNKDDSSAMDEFRAKYSENSDTNTDKNNGNKPRKNRQ